MLFRPLLHATLLLSACFGAGPPSPPSPPSPDVDASGPPPDAYAPPPDVVSRQVRDHDGDPWPEDAVPRRPIIEVTLRAPLADVSEVLLLALEADGLAELEDDLRSAPLRQAHRSLAVPSTIQAEGPRVRLTPDRALEGGRGYVLLIPPWAEGLDGQRIAEALVVPLRCAERDAGATFQASWPPAGAAGVPRALPSVAIRFDDRVRRGDTTALMGPEGAVPSEISTVDCAGLAWLPGSCLELRPGGPLKTGSHRVVIPATVLDRGGAPVGPRVIEFEVGTLEHVSVAWLPLACSPDETPIGPGCGLVDDTSALLRFHAAGPVRAWLRGPSGEQRRVGSRGELRFAIAGLPSATSMEFRLRVESLSGDTFHEVLPISTQSSLPPLAISEVRADPRGPEPRQEYVELWNHSDAELTPGLLFLADAPEREGDAVALPPLAPGERILVVPSGFDPTHRDDEPVPEGVRLVRVDRSLGSGGLSNTGEVLVLRDAEGRRIASMPARPSEGAGRCLLRRGSGRGALDVFEFGSCSPGRP